MQAFHFKKMFSEKEWSFALYVRVVIIADYNPAINIFQKDMIGERRAVGYIFIASYSTNSKIHVCMRDETNYELCSTPSFQKSKTYFILWFVLKV